MTDVFTDDDEILSADKNLRSTVEEFNWTLSHFGVSLGIKTYTLLEGTKPLLYSSNFEQKFEKRLPLFVKEVPK